ncbi:glycoside hydrolase [Scheffersomyces xylosifermentans]|uniref:glycoside hydrolase n=1 Tax=Scheffersomyces xylosifermentans TaxID=1304137 RepID=UPI00315D651E
MLEQFGSLSPANVQKWQFTEPKQGVFNYTQADDFVNFALKNKKSVVCDTLVWHQEYPSWLDQKKWTKEELLKVIDQHVYSEVSHFKNRCFSWNVVNEALNDDGTWRETLFYNVTGTDYIATAFRAAARADPKAQLFYNDYNIESPSAKSTAVENLVKTLKKQNIKIDAVGLESHFIVGETPSEAQQQQQMQAYIDLGVQVLVSELDVRFSALPPTEAGLVQQTNDYQSSINACIKVGKQCMGLYVWDFDDAYSWIPSTFPGNGDGDLWYANFTTTPAYDGVVSALEAGELKNY